MSNVSVCDMTVQILSVLTSHGTQQAHGTQKTLCLLYTSIVYLNSLCREPFTLVGIQMDPDLQNRKPAQVAVTL